MTNYSSIRYASSGATGSGTTVYADMNALIAATGTDGAQAFVQSNNNIYVYAGTGWYKIATVQNDSPSAITGVNGSYSLAIDGTPTVITAVSTDPEGFPLTWTYSTSGLGSIAAISQEDNVFTITPSTDDTNFGTFTLTINATDGVNGAVSTNTSITLQFYILNSNYTTLLATAVDISDNSSFTDSSTNALTLSPINAPTSSSFSPYRSGGYSTYFDGAGDYIRYTDASLAEGTDDFTVEFWVRRDGAQSLNDTIVGHDTTPGWQICFNSDGSTIRWMTNATDASRVLPASLNDRQWHHIVYQRSSGTLQGFLDGVSLGTASVSTNFTNDKIEIGVNRGGTAYFTGNVRDVRIIKGTAFYSSSGFDVPTEPLTAVSGTGYSTTLLSCHLPYITDGGANSLTPTVNGNTSTKPFTPYDNLEYSAADHGGSIYFDTSGSTGTSGGSGQYVQSALSSELTLDTNDFTIDCWVYGISKARNYPRVLQIGPQNTPWGSSQLAILYKHNDDNDSICLAMNGIGGNAMLIASGPINDNQWYHVAVTRSGSTFTMYINGESVGTYTSTGSATGTGDKAILIGSSSAGDSDFNGYISDLRVLNGTVVYTGNFTPPTEPVSSSAAAVHVVGTDASIIDKAQTSNLQLVGNTTGSTTQVKFADTKSMYFDGTGDYVYIDADVANFGTGDFTIEMWLYPTESDNGIFRKTTSTGSSSPPSLSVYVVGTTPLVGVNSGTADGSWITASSSFSNNAWNHFAITRNSGTVTIWINGNSSGSATRTADVDNNITFRLGEWRNSSENYKGYIQDFRLTKGLARYTANFTPPTEPLKG